MGTGGDGIVWRALDEQLNRVVAVKRALPADNDRGPERVRMLRREAEILAQLNHPNIVTLYDLVSEGAEWWLVMEYVASRSLADRGKLPPGLAARLGAQIAEALEVVHAAGVLHRDIKPGNVLVTGDDRAKLGDFGISRAVWSAETLTDADGLFIGTPGYAAPELARGIADPSPASDVFSLGATLFAAVEGTSPFGTAENPRVLLRRTENGAVDPAEHAGPLAPVLSALLRPDPAERPTVTEARRMLEEIAAPPTARGGSRPAASDRSGIGLIRSGAARDRAAIVAGVIVAVGALVLTVVGYGEAPAGPPPPRRAAPVPAIGDQRTADPCALTDPALFGRFGHAELSTDFGGFDRCDVLIGEGHTAVDVETQLGTPTDELPTGIERIGALGVVREPASGGECDRTVYLPDRSRIHISAEQNGRGRKDLCAIADTETSKAVAVLSRGQIPRRKSLPVQASLFNVNACALLDARGLSRFPGVDALHPEPMFGNWGCTWESTTSQDMLQLIFDQGEPLTADDGRPIQLGARRAFVVPNGDGDNTCNVDVVNRQYKDANGDQTVETLLVIITSDLSQERRCALATSLAGPAAARLPGT